MVEKPSKLADGHGQASSPTATTSGRKDDLKSGDSEHNEDARDGVGNCSDANGVISQKNHCRDDSFELNQQADEDRAECREGRAASHQDRDPPARTGHRDPDPRGTSEDFKKSPERSK